MAALNHQKMTNHPERVSNLKPFMDNYNWNDLEFPAGIKTILRLKKITQALLEIYYMYVIRLKK